MSAGVLSGGLLAERKPFFVKRARQLVIAFESCHSAQTIEGDVDLASPPQLAMKCEGLYEGCSRGRAVLGYETKRQEQVSDQAFVPRLPRHFETFCEERARGRMVSPATRQITERVECARNHRFVVQVFAQGQSLINQCARRGLVTHPPGDVTEVQEGNRDPMLVIHFPRNAQALLEDRSRGRDVAPAEGQDAEVAERHCHQGFIA